MDHVEIRSRGRVHEVWMFVRHFLEMCAAMCVGGGLLNALIFVAGPALVGYPDLREETPALALLVIALNYLAPMVVWMRFRGMPWRPILEMSGAVVALAVVFIGLAASWCHHRERPALVGAGVLRPSVRGHAPGHAAPTGPLHRTNAIAAATARRVASPPTGDGSHAMSARYAYFYFMGTDADRVSATAPAHAAHWRELGLDDYLGGPFEDRSGGLITFRVASEAQADSAVATDPFVTTGLLETYWIKRWRPE